jgi:hypothetical protein
MAEKSRKELIATLVVSFIGAGSGAVSWLKYFQNEPISLSATLEQNDFHSPVMIPLTLKREATLTIVGTATALAYNPLAGTTPNHLESGLRIKAAVDGKPCAEPKVLTIPGPILDGSKQLRLDIGCRVEKLSPGKHFIELSATFTGSCQQVPDVPATCNTNRIRGGYALVESPEAN